jgi:uridine phosphorylase
MKKFLPSELIVNASGSIYHLDIKPEEIAHKIIVVGDQDRVKDVAKHFDTITHESKKREFSCSTGMYMGKKLSVLSTGIGTDNIDIVINELDALVNIDLATRTEKKEKTKLEILRIGTCGILQPDIPVDSFILSTHAMGIDNIGHFYQLQTDDKTENLLKEIKAQVKLPEQVIPYLTPASNEINKRLKSNDVVEGITVTSSGFYGPQGRKLRLPLTAPEMNDSLDAFHHEGNRFSNLEMECSALFALCTALGHEASAICLGLANRRKKEFSTNYKVKMDELITFVLDRF